MQLKLMNLITNCARKLNELVVMLKRIEDYQEAVAFIERLKEAGVEPERIRIYEWIDVMADGNLEILKHRERYGIEVVKK